MVETLAEVIFSIREEIGLDLFRIGDKVKCNLYRTAEIQFNGSIHSVNKTQYADSIYLINCPVYIGFPLTELSVKVKDSKTLDQSLYYRWVEGNMLELIYP